MSANPAIRKLTIQPRKRGYKHRDIIVVREEVGFTEYGEVVNDLVRFAMAQDSHIFVVYDSADLLNLMLKSHAPDFNYQLIDVRETDVPEGTAFMSSTRLTRFGWSRHGGGRAVRRPKRHRAMHIVWSIPDMMRDPSKVMGGGAPHEVMRFAVDVRDWCKDYNIPLPTALSGISAALLRDPRFYPNPRGRIPKATNNRLRHLLPGVHSELRAETGKTYHTAVALDQRRAYHRAAQATPLPSGDTLFARGYFNAPDDAPIWADKGSPVYRRTIAQPGLLLVKATSRLTHKRETRPPALDFQDTKNIYLWTNEVPIAEETGVDIHGIIAAWTSTTHDEGIPLYAAWAEKRIDEADHFRAAWLKPTLHGVYGLLAARPRDLRIGHALGSGIPRAYMLGLGHIFRVREVHLGAAAPATNNVGALGMLQAEIRLRSMRLANGLMMEGVDVLHIHADGIHTRGPLPLIPTDWSVEPRTNLRYLDKVSWLAAEGDTLPGRDQQARREIVKHLANLISKQG